MLPVHPQNGFTLDQLLELWNRVHQKWDVETSDELICLSPFIAGSAIDIFYVLLGMPDK